MRKTIYRQDVYFETVGFNLRIYNIHDRVLLRRVQTLARKLGCLDSSRENDPNYEEHQLKEELNETFIFLNLRAKIKQNKLLFIYCKMKASFRERNNQNTETS